MPTHRIILPPDTVRTRDFALDPVQTVEVTAFFDH